MEFIFIALILLKVFHKIDVYSLNKFVELNDV